MAAKKKQQALRGNFALLFVILLICVLLIAVIVASSRKNKNPDDSDSTNTENTDDIITITDAADTLPPITDVIGTEASDSSNPETEEDRNTPDIEIIIDKVTSDGGKTDMQYPVIEKKYDGEQNTDVMNEIIKAYMDKRLMDEKRDSGMLEPDSEYTYKITSSEPKLITDDFVSVVVKGEYYVKETAHPEIFAYTVNCDLKSGKILSSEDIFTDFASVRDKFTDGKFVLCEGNDDLLKETNYEDIIMEYRPAYGIYPDAYYTDDSFGICVELVYSLGGYALFEIPIDDVSGAVYVPQK